MPEATKTAPEQLDETARMPLGDNDLRPAYLEAAHELSGTSPALATEEDINRAVSRAMGGTWWRQLPMELRRYGVDPALVDNLQLAGRHSVDFTYEGIPTGQGFTVFELTRQEEDREAVEVVIQTLELIDQWSGGLLANASQRLNIVLNNGFRLFSTQYKNNDGTPRQNAGLAYAGMILINMPYLRDLAKEYPGVDLHNLLATTVVHEVLGHRVEAMVEGDTGKYFSRFFRYSDRGQGDLYPSMFRQITAIEAGHEDSHPAREYGCTGPIEDVATAVDAMVAGIMGWEETNRHSPRFRNTPDPYREELAMQLMDRAAELAKRRGYVGVPGVVGAEMAEHEGAEGTQPLQRARIMQVTDSYGTAALQEEFKAIVADVVSTRPRVMARGDASYTELLPSREICM